jgi:hypothetical protein
MLWENNYWRIIKVEKHNTIYICKKKNPLIDYILLKFLPDNGFIFSDSKQIPKYILKLSDHFGKIIKILP